MSIRHPPTSPGGPTEQDLREWNNMVAGRVYNPGDPYILSQNLTLSGTIKAINAEEDMFKRGEMIKDVIGRGMWDGSGSGWAGESGGMLLWMTPLMFSYGHLDIGEQVVIFPGAHFLDICTIRLGTRTMIGANCCLLADGHSIWPNVRWPRPRPIKAKKPGDEANRERNLQPTADGAPITIGDDVWIGANVTVLQGVRVGNGCVIGACSLVNKDIPDGCIAAGTPCRIIKRLCDLTQETREEYIERFMNGDNGGHMGRVAPYADRRPWDGAT